MVSTHKDIEDKLLAEIDSVMGDRDVPTHDDLSRLRYLKMVCIALALDLRNLTSLVQVLKETLRMYPPAATARRLPMGYKLGSYTVDYPKTDVVISSFVVHHDPAVSFNPYPPLPADVLTRASQFWKDPEIFDPERFSEENSKGRPPLAYIPFLAGNRNCIGQHMAYLEATVAMAMIFKRFTFRMAYDDHRIFSLLFFILMLTAIFVQVWLRAQHGLPHYQRMRQRHADVCVQARSQALSLSYLHLNLCGSNPSATQKTKELDLRLSRATS